METMSKEQTTEPGGNAEAVIPPEYPPTPTLDPDDSNARVVETPMAEALPILPPPSSPAAAAVAAATNQPDFRYFKKALVNMPFFSEKKRVNFEVLGENTGVIKLDPSKDAATIAALEAAAQAHRGGIVIITAEDYADLKKKLPWTPSARKSQPEIRVWDSQPRGVPKSRASPAANSNSAEAPGSHVAHGAVAPVAGGVAGAGKPPATFTPNLQPKSAGKGPVLRAPSSGKFAEGVPLV